MFTCYLFLFFSENCSKSSPAEAPVKKHDGDAVTALLGNEK